MQSDYTFLTDHSYSIRVDYDKLSLKQREMKHQKRRGTSKRSSKIASTNHTVSIHRGSSDKENNSSSPIDVPTATRNTPGNKKKTSTKKKTTKSPAQSGKKATNKTLSKPIVKSTSSKIIKKKKSIIRPLVSHSLDTSSISTSLSIEERVKLRRTTPFLTPVKPRTTISRSSHPLKSVKRIHVSQAKKSIIKPKKFFLGSGLDLDNIVPGNRRQRSVQT